MSIFKMTTDQYGMIEGVQEIFAGDYDAAGVGGYVVEDKILAQEMLADLNRARATKGYDIDNDIIFDRPVIETEPVKSLLNISLGDTLVIPGLPVPCTIEVLGQVFSMNDPADTTFECVIDFPGTYEVKVTAWPYQDKSWEVTVV